jgi:hypothetical protein
MRLCSIQYRLSYFLYRNGECETECYNDACCYDRGDCNECSISCLIFYIGNGVCDTECKNEACKYDEQHCNFEVNECSIECEELYIGDGKCNNLECECDGGDFEQIYS